MRLILVLCVMVLAGTALAMPGMIRERMAHEFRNKKGVGGFKRPLNPLHVFRNQLSKSTKSAIHQKKMICELCPPPSDIKPCLCVCECCTKRCLANIICNSTVVTSSEVERVLSLPSYPVRDYDTLLVENTLVNGIIDQKLLGSTVTFKEINIRHNEVSGVARDAFDNTSDTLQKLILSSNQILYIDFIREDMPNIQYIDISNNSLCCIPQNAMSSETLNFLDISYNDVKFVETNAFAGLIKLTHLDLSHNRLITLKSNSFVFKNHKDFPLLVNLSHNRISIIESNVFNGVKEMTVDLTYNSLETLNEEIFRNFIDSTDGSIHIDVSGNPIVCDCSLLWVVENSTVANCFDDFPVCDSTIRYVTPENLGDCGHDYSTVTPLR